MVHIIKREALRGPTNCNKIRELTQVLDRIVN
jgi:hypothetical protein